MRRRRRCPTAIVDHTISRSGDELRCAESLEDYGEARRQHGNELRWTSLGRIPESLLVLQIGFRSEAEQSRFVQLPLYFFARSGQTNDKPRMKTLTLDPSPVRRER